MVLQQKANNMRLNIIGLEKGITICFVVITVAVLSLIVIGCDSESSSSNSSPKEVNELPRSISELDDVPFPENTFYSGIPFEIYSVEGGDMRHSSDSVIDIDSLQIGTKPFITSEDIEEYDWNEHTMLMNNDFEVRYQGYGSNVNIASNNTYVIVANGEGVCLCHSRGIGSSHLPEGVLVHFQSYNPVTIQLKYRSYSDHMPPDMRNDKRIKEALLEAGVLIE